MDLIEKKIKKNIHRATLNPKGSEALVPFNLDGQWYVSILIPRGKAHALSRPCIQYQTRSIDTFGKNLPIPKIFRDLGFP